MRGNPSAAPSLYSTAWCRVSTVVRPTMGNVSARVRAKESPGQTRTTAALAQRRTVLGESAGRSAYSSTDCPTRGGGGARGLHAARPPGAPRRGISTSVAPRVLPTVPGACPGRHPPRQAAPGARAAHRQVGRRPHGQAGMRAPYPPPPAPHGPGGGAATTARRGCHPADGIAVDYWTQRRFRPEGTARLSSGRLGTETRLKPRPGAASGGDAG